MSNDFCTSDLGNLGEDAAAKHMLSNGYEIISRNYKSKFGEIDIIAKKDEYIIFCEVKARKSTLFGDPCEAVSFSKRRKIRLTAYDYIQQNNIELPMRFDVCEIIHSVKNGRYQVCKINYIKGAFEDV